MNYDHIWPMTADATFGCIYLQTHEEAYAALGARVVVLLSLGDNEVVTLENITSHPNYQPALHRMEDIVEFEANMSDVSSTLVVYSFIGNIVYILMCVVTHSKEWALYKITIYDIHVYVSWGTEYTGWSPKNGTVDTVNFSGLCSDQQLSFFHLAG